MYKYLSEIRRGRNIKHVFVVWGSYSVPETESQYAFVYLACCADKIVLHDFFENRKINDKLFF